MQRRTLAYLALVAAPLLWAGNWVIARPLVTRVSPLDVTFARWVLASAALLPVVRWQEGRLPRLDRRMVMGVAVSGVLGMVGYTILQYVALQHTLAINGTLIFTATPALTVALAAAFLGERWTARQVAGIGLTLVGVGVILTGGSAAVLRQLAINPGDALMLLADGTWAGYTVATRALASRLSSMASTAYAMVAAVVLLLPVQVAGWLSGRSALVPGGLGWADAAAIVYIALFASAGAYVCWGEGVRRVGAGAASVFGNLLPVFTALLAGLFLGERLTAAHVAGALAVMVGVYLTVRREARFAHTLRG